MVGHLQGVHDFLTKPEDVGVFSQANMNSHPHPVTLKRLTRQQSVQQQQRRNSHPCDLLFALGAVWSVSIIVAVGTIDGASLLEEPSFVQDLLTL